MNEQQIKQNIRQLEAQHEEALVQLGRIQGALAVYRAMLEQPAQTQAQPSASPKDDAPAAGDSPS